MDFVTKAEKSRYWSKAIYLRSLSRKDDLVATTQDNVNQTTPTQCNMIEPNRIIETQLLNPIKFIITFRIDCDLTVFKN